MQIRDGSSPDDEDETAKLLRQIERNRSLHGQVKQKLQTTALVTQSNRITVDVLHEATTAFQSGSNRGQYMAVGSEVGPLLGLLATIFFFAITEWAPWKPTLG